MLLYLTILCVAFAGLIQLPMWTVAIGAAGLSAVIVSEKIAGRLSPIGSDRFQLEGIAMLAALLNGSAAATASYAIGRVTAWVWGV